MMQWFDIQNVLFSIDGKDISLLELCTVLMGITAVYLAARSKSINYYLQFVNAFLMGWLFWQKHLYTNMLLQPICLAINIYGLYRWTHPKEAPTNAQHELKVSRLSFRAWSVYVLALGAFVGLWGRMLQHVHLWSQGAIAAAVHPYLDAFTAALLVSALSFAALKKYETWFFWIAVNIGNLILYLLSGFVFMPLLSVAYLLINGIALVHWRKEEKAL